MTKRTSAIPIAFMLAILAVLLVFMCLPQHQAHVTAVDGSLDLHEGILFDIVAGTSIMLSFPAHLP